MQTDLSPEAVSILKEVGLLVGFGGKEKLTSSHLVDRLAISTQTASRRLQDLEESDHLERDIVRDGQWVSITATGECRLRAEYEDYCTIFKKSDEFLLSGKVTSGMGEGRHYISLPGYMSQFREKLGYEPFAGTLNVKLDDASARNRGRLDRLTPITIEGWADSDRTYGPVYCYEATIEVGDEAYEGAHIIGPERTHHGKDNLEIIAVDKLRTELDVVDDDEVIVRVTH